MPHTCRSVEITRGLYSVYFIVLVIHWHLLRVFSREPLYRATNIFSLVLYRYIDIPGYVAVRLMVCYFDPLLDVLISVRRDGSVGLGSKTLSNVLTRCVYSTWLLPAFITQSVVLIDRPLLSVITHSLRPHLSADIYIYSCLCRALSYALSVSLVSCAPVRSLYSDTTRDGTARSACALRPDGCTPNV